MERNKYLFICCTPYQLLNTLNLKLEMYKNVDVDIIIVNKFAKAQSYYNSIKKSNIIRNVYFLDKFKNATIKKEKKYFNKLKITDYIEEFKLERYDKLFISNNLYFSNTIFSELKKKNHSLKLIILEDGIGTYIEKFEVLGIKWSIMRCLVGEYCIKQNDIDEILVYDKELICVDTNASINEIPKLNHNIGKKIIEILNIKSNLKEYREAIFFDQPFLKDNTGIDERDIMKGIVKITSELHVKYHPRQNKKIYNFVQDNISEYKSIYEIWELDILNLNIENTNLITVNSTAVFTPTILYGYKSNIILLNNINEIKEKLEGPFDSFVTKFKNKYGGVVYEPKTYEELKNILRGQNLNV